MWDMVRLARRRQWHRPDNIKLLKEIRDLLAPVKGDAV
jgi:hypothetical protein